MKISKVEIEKYKNSYFWKKNVWSIARWVLLVGIMFVLVYPLLFSLSTSLKSMSDMLDPTSIWLAKNPTLHTYVDAFNKTGYMSGFKNTVTIAVSASLLQIISCSFIGYGIARFKFKERNLIFGLILFTLVVPVQTLAIPQFIQYKNMGILDSFWPFILPACFGLGLRGGLFIYIFRQFFKGLPKELEDAAYIDGCGVFKTYFRIMLPNAKPAILTVFLFSFVWHWNDIFSPTIYIQSDKLMTLSMKLTNISTYIAKGAEEAMQMADPTTLLPTKYAGILLTILPVIILYAIAQKHFVESVERSGIVG